MKTVLITGAYRGLGYEVARLLSERGLKDKGIAVSSVCPGWCRTEMGGPTAPRSVEEGAAGITWLAADAPQGKTGLFWRDRQVIAW